ncbi:hypothetical protein [Nocardia sp. NPDC003963]
MRATVARCPRRIASARVEVHRALRDLVPHLYLFGVQRGPIPQWVRHARTWPEVEDAILPWS